MVKTLAVPAEDIASVPSTHIRTLTTTLWFPGIQYPLLTSMKHRQTSRQTHIHINKNKTHVYTKQSNCMKLDLLWFLSLKYYQLTRENVCRLFPSYSWTQGSVKQLTSLQISQDGKTFRLLSFIDILKMVRI